MDRASLESEFVGVTGGSREQASFFLDAHNNDLQAAIIGYYESPQASAHAVPAASPAAAAVTTSSSSSAAASSSSSAPRSRMMGLSDVAARDEKDAEGKDTPNTYFAGGGKNSGIAVEGPPDSSSSDKKKAANLVQDILKQASERGPRPPGEGDDDDDDDDDAMDEDAAPARPAFTGAGYRLGSEEEGQLSASSQPVAGSSSTAAAAAAGGASGVPDRSGGRLPKVTRTLTFWKNGFSIEDGPLMEYDKPENQQILEALKSGRAPVHILNVQYGQPVDLKVAHKLEEQYKPPPMKPFAGSGQRLGSVVPGDAGTAGRASALPGAFPTSPSTPSAPVPSSAPRLQVDENKPVTTLQLRLADGTRLVAQFNHDHRVGDVRNFINSARPGESSRQYVLQTTFPNRELNNGDVTLKEAGILSAVVVQRYV